MSGAAWRFWTGNAINPAEEHYRRVIEKNGAEEAQLTAREEELAQVGEELGKRFGFGFVRVSRRHPNGTSIPKDPRLAWMVPPKRVFEFTFHAGPDGLARWRVLDALGPLPEGISFWGKLSWGWRFSLEAEGAEEKLAELSRQMDQRAEAKKTANREKTERRRKEREERAQQRKKTASPPHVEEEANGGMAEALREAGLIE